MFINAKCSSVDFAGKARKKASWLPLAMAVGTCMSVANHASATIYNPYSFSSLGTLNSVSASSVLINTNGPNPTITVGSTTYTGVVDSQGGMAGAGGAPGMAVFDFGSVILSSAAPITISGSNGVAILSRGNFISGATINVSGQAGANGATGAQSTTLGGFHGAGGFSGGNAGQPYLTNGMKFGGAGTGSAPGGGPGGGGNAGTNGLFPSDTGGGGGFGGPGGTGNGGANDLSQSNAAGGPGGAPYGVTTPLGAFTPLYGGSGGGGGNYVNADFLQENPNGYSTGGGGGGGAGAIEIVSIGSLQLNSGISANGGTGGQGGGYAGAGGGGSGGDIILVGNSVSVSNGSATANGGGSLGNAGDGSMAAGGGGGGGRILVDSMASSTGTYTANGGGTYYTGGTGSVSQLTSGVSTSVPNLVYRRGTSGSSGTVTISSAGSSGSVVFGQFSAPSNFSSHVTGLPTSGTTFTLDAFNPTESLILNDSSSATTATGTISFTSNVGTVNIPVLYGAAGPQFSTNMGTSGTIGFGAVDIGASKTINLVVSNSSTDLGGSDLSPTTQLDITGYSLTTVVNNQHVPVTNSVIGVQTLPGEPIHEGQSINIPLIFSPNDNQDFSATLQIFTDQDAAVGSTGDIFTYTLTGTGQNPLLGDANYDNAVNTVDYNALINGFNKQLTGWSNGDFNQDGVINADDFALFAKGVAEYDAGLASAPEPTGTTMLLLLICPLLRRRR